MPLTDRLDDTHATALKHDLVDVSPDASLVGVVRRPPRRFDDIVDENIRTLGPSVALLDAFKQQYERFKMQGLCDEEAHNAAWETVDFDDRYCSYLRSDPSAREHISALADRLRDDEHIVLVCVENTDRHRCHRTLLRDRIEATL